MSGRPYPFHGGLDLPGHKTASNGRPIRPGPVPELKAMVELRSK